MNKHKQVHMSSKFWKQLWKVALYGPNLKSRSSLRKIIWNPMANVLETQLEINVKHFLRDFYNL